MGRSVSTPTHAVATCYGYLHEHKHECLHCDHRFDEHKEKPVSEDDGYTESTIKVCPSRDAGEDDTQEIDPQWEFDGLVECLQDGLLTDAFKSLKKCDTWLDNEDHALLENRFCHIGASEYCGVVALWLVPKDGPWHGDPGWEALRDRWLDSITPRFTKLATIMLPGAMARLGTFSNGESVYRRLAA